MRKQSKATSLNVSLSNKQSKTQRYPAYIYIKQRKAANPHAGEAAVRE